jgi:GTPase SAR1 family protein
MSIATLTNIEKNFGRRVLFDKLNLTVYRGERIGLLGDNGSGKTTLLKVLTGQFMPDAGSASISESVKVGYLTQDPVFDMTNTVIDEAELAFAELHDLSHRMRDIEHEMEHLTGAELEKVLDKYQTVQHDFELAGGYAWRHKLEATLLGISRCPRCPAGRNRGWRWPSCSSPGRTCCSWTSRRTIWTWRRSSGWKTTCWISPGRWCSSATTVSCSTGSPRASSG